MNLIQTFIDRKQDIWLAFQEHIMLSAISMAVAILVSVPLGILLTRNKRIAEPVIGVAAIIQTIPSLALLGFMLPIFGIGKLPAIIALTLYALLPILRNTYTGILGVDPALVDAGKGMGMTSWQILWMVELPLSLPVIMAGVRTATVLTIGVAALATFIGAGGLGDLIDRGLRVADKNLILAGAIPAAILAILFDLILKKIENKVTPKGLKP
ncbi:binding--dependent transport system inner membrane component family protein [Anoxybacillus sp. B7M1]|jgi:osmoprotectant transport system permease protein|uniref:ABC transporter permease n=1 Tax=unclassified Anoxybacillus TaxID=2639704 RepID=UPI0005CD4DD6|nr:MULTISPECIES: ABC transporter permease [unclassified Anoxybacillus]ANB57710.1 binding--dependent transport system inner membrane component family protein [Anoxybacillus sp. B2M1]ANB63619.1 binding--dependent transport system inner membrane component family protein [Anoxybacillus sp. B7M1]OQM47356.1 glycine/betaine ABC transporter [Anoxybacillus sp. UARK-01]